MTPAAHALGGLGAIGASLFAGARIALRRFDRRHPHLTRRALREQEHPMRDLHDEHVSDMMLDLTGVRGPVPPVAAAPATHVHAGARNGAGGAPRPSCDAMRARPVADFVVDHATGDAILSVARLWVDAVWDAAVALARAEPPVSVAGHEAWEEGDADLVKRLRRGSFDFALRAAEREGRLNEIAVERGLPQARLARAEG